MAAPAQSTLRPAADPVFAGALINSADPARLRAFYAAVFGGALLPPSSAAAPELHWRTPGDASSAPLLMFARCQADSPRRPLRANEQGYAHLCFEADDVGGVLRRIQAHGGQVVSSFARPQRQPGVYAADPDGNLVEVHLPFPARLTPAAVLRTLGTLLRIKAGWAPARDSRLRFIHVNVVVPNWAAAVDFYEQGLGACAHGCRRDYKGPYIGTLVGIPGAAVRGRHVALPGYPAGGPTFEVFTYADMPTAAPHGPHDAGIALTEFHSRDVAALAQRLLQAGAVRVPAPDAAAVLLRDPNGHLLRLRALVPATRA